MSGILETITNINDKISSVVWGVPLLAIMIITGVYFSIRLGFFQVTRIRLWFSKTIVSVFKKDSRKGTTKVSEGSKAISQFQALCASLAATIGTGNIAGVATAVTAGGPGAVFWMWFSAFFGMMTSYSENLLGIYYRKKNSDGEWCGGPMYYLEDGLKEKKKLKKLGKPLAVLFAFFCLLASFGIGNMTQANSISSALLNEFHVPLIASGIVIAIVCFAVIAGGIKRIGSVMEKLVPFMALFYIIGTLYIFFSNSKSIPYVFSSIFENAFSFKAIYGAGTGLIIKKCISMGFRRGIFSNEAGLGATVMVSSSSDIKEPCEQGMWGIFQVFADTMIVCTLTAFVLLSTTTDAVNLNKALENVTDKSQYVYITDIDSYESETGAHLTDITPQTIIRISDTGDTYDCYNDKGEKFNITVTDDMRTESDVVYTNIMSLRGIEIDENGKEVRNGKNINAVAIEKVDGVPLVTYAFSQRIGSFAGTFLSIAVVLFAFSTLIGWSFYGVKATEYLFGKKYIKFYKALYIAAVVLGSVMELSIVWDISDTLNGLMAFPNLLGLLVLSGTVIRVSKNYMRRRKGEDITPDFSAREDIQKEYEISYYENK